MATLKAIIHSNAPFAPTGYGGQNALLVPALKSLGHEVMLSNFYGNQGAPLKLDGVFMLPTSKDAYGNDVLIADHHHWGADLTITLIDVWIFRPEVLAAIKAFVLFPVDCDPLPPVCIPALRAAAYKCAYSKFGVEKAKEAGISDVLYIPHMVDTKTYYPMDKTEARRMLKVRDGDFLISIVAANKGNPSRKSFDQQIRGFAEFHKRYPNSTLYIHSDMQGGYDGENIKRIVHLAGIEGSCIAEPPPYEFMRGMLGIDYMRCIYNASDVLMNCTRGEGFGVPIIESMACGTPAIVTDCTAMPELIDAGAGYKVDVLDCFFYMDSYQFIPSVKSIAEKLEQAYEDKQSGKLAEMGKTARAGMVANYDTEYVTQNYWKPILEKIAGELADIKARTASRAAKRAEGRAKAGLSATGRMLPAVPFLVGGDSGAKESISVSGQIVSGTAMLDPTATYEPVDGKVTIAVTDSTGKSATDAIDVIAKEVDGQARLVEIEKDKTETAAD